MMLWHSATEHLASARDKNNSLRTARLETRGPRNRIPQACLSEKSEKHCRESLAPNRRLVGLSTCRRFVPPLYKFSLPFEHRPLSLRRVCKSSRLGEELLSREFGATAGHLPAGW